MRANRSVYILVSFLIAGPLTAVAERLPLSIYTVDQGLSNDHVKHVLQDSHGFIWVSTANGLSRFDGHRFYNFTIADGLPNRSINFALETKKGVYWIATNGGGIATFGSVAEATEEPLRLLPAGRSRFTVYAVGDNSATNRVNAVFEDRLGTIWAATDGGVFRFSVMQNRFEPIEIGTPAQPDRRILVWNFVEDAEGTLWICTSMGLVRRLWDGRIFRYWQSPDGNPRNTLILHRDREGRIWVGFSVGVVVFTPTPVAELKENEPFPWKRIVRGERIQMEGGVGGRIPRLPGLAYWFTTASGLSGEQVMTFYEAPDGHIWIGTNKGLSVFDGTGLRTFSIEHGLASDGVQWVTGDRAGSLWLATPASGLIKLSDSGFVSYDESDGLGSDYVLWVGEDSHGRLLAATGQWLIHYFDGERFHAVRPLLPTRFTQGSRRLVQRTLRDHLGEWWVATPEGVYRYPHVERLEDLSRTPPKAIYTVRDGLLDDSQNTILEDGHGDLWFGAFLPGTDVLTRWERKTGKFHRYGQAHGLPPFHAFLSCATDRDGGVWVGFRDGGLARFKDGRFKVLSEANGVSNADVASLRVDGSGRLWAIISPELGWIDDPSSDEPKFRPVHAASSITGLVGGTAIGEDRSGRLYFYPGKGLARLDPTTGLIKHFTSAEGASNHRLIVAYRDLHGALWFGTQHGLIKVVPQSDPPALAPTVMIAGVRVAGVEFGVPTVGASSLGVDDLATDQNDLTIEFLGLSFGLGEVLRFQYKLEGSDQEWTAPNERRAVDYANLEPGKYRFVVRAVNSDGLVTENAASVSFSILPPIWRQWWFLTLIGVVVAAALYAFERMRVSRLIELERVRMRIATDLHDDIGAGLSRIAILSEIGNHKLGTGDLNGREQMSVIAGASRELLDSMSDIVWAINPKKEHLKDLVQRMRRFASDVLSGRNIEFLFKAPENEQELRLGADVRREVFLIFKESVNNLAKHARAEGAEIELEVANRSLILRISDNGCGFDPAIRFNGASEGNGLASMQERAERLRGQLDIASTEMTGTTVVLKVPLNRRKWNDAARPEDPRRRRRRT